MMKNRLSFLAPLVFLLISASVSRAQTTLGLELGAGSHTQLGNMTCDCGASFSGGTGDGLSLLGVLQYAVKNDFSFGAKLGFVSKKSSANTMAWDTSLVYSGPPIDPRLDTIAMNTKRVETATLSLLRIQPFLQYQVAGSGFFLQASPSLSYLLTSNHTQYRELLSNSIVLHNGTVINNVTFSNGSSRETIDDGAIPNSLLLSAIFSAGYKFDLFGITVAPLVSYELPISNVQKDQNWKLSSWYGSVAFLFAP